MSNKTIMTEQDIELMQRRIDEGILLAQHKLLVRAKHDNLSLVICKNGIVTDTPASEIETWK